MISLNLSLKDRIALFNKGSWPIIFLVFFVIGPVLFQVGGGMQAFVDLQFRFKEVKRTRGYVVDMIETNLSKDGYAVYQYDYTFPIGLETIYGTSFSSEFDLSLDQKIPIEYIADKPYLSRIVGSSYTKTSAFAYIGVGLFLVAAVFIPIRWQRGNRISSILVDGTVIRAEFVESNETAIEINEERLHELTYHYKAGNDTYFEYLRTTRPFEAEKYITVVYSNKENHRSIVASKLPNHIAQKVEELAQKHTGN